MNGTRFDTGFLNLEEEKKRISELISCRGASLSQFAINDDGYQIRIILKDQDITLKDICKVVDEIDFKGFIVNDLLYRADGVEALLVPIEHTTMNNFVWNYVKTFLYEHEEIEALSLALGVLEHMVEHLPGEVKKEYETYSTMVFN